MVTCQNFTASGVYLLSATNTSHLILLYITDIYSFAPNDELYKVATQLSTYHTPTHKSGGCEEDKLRCFVYMSSDCFCIRANTTASFCEANRQVSNWHCMTVIIIIILYMPVSTLKGAHGAVPVKSLQPGSAHRIDLEKLDMKWDEHRVFTLLFPDSVQRTRQGVTLLPSSLPFYVLIRGAVSAIQPLFTSRNGWKGRSGN